MFVLAIITVAYWGSVDEQAVEELPDRIEAIEEQEEEATDDAR